MRANERPPRLRTLRWRAKICQLSLRVLEEGLHVRQDLPDPGELGTIPARRGQKVEKLFVAISHNLAEQAQSALEKKTLERHGSELLANLTVRRLLCALARKARLACDHAQAAHVYSIEPLVVLTRHLTPDMHVEGQPRDHQSIKET